MSQHSDLETFYTLLGALETRTGRRRLKDCHGRMIWPERGVYFLFEPGELRTTPSATRRVVRVGTHALAEKSGTTLWTRLRQHRGTNSPPGGNHRGSIFRLLIGEALMRRDPSLAVASWGHGQSAPREVRAQEREHEARVSEYLGNMEVVCLGIPDAPGPDSARGIVERNSIALLSTCHRQGTDPATTGWLGHHSGRDRVHESGLWNNNHVGNIHDPGFLALLNRLVQSATAIHGS